MPGWVKALLDDWLKAANLTAGRLFRRVNKKGKAWGAGLTEKAVWHLLGHVSIQTRERYLIRKQRIQSAVNDRIGIEPEG
jgi:hypothetical protein